MESQLPAVTVLKILKVDGDTVVRFRVDNKIHQVSLERFKKYRSRELSDYLLERYDPVNDRLIGRNSYSDSIN